MASYVENLNSSASVPIQTDIDTANADSRRGKFKILKERKNKRRKQRKHAVRRKKRRPSKKKKTRRKKRKTYMFPAKGDIRSLLSQFPLMILEYGELTPIAVTKRRDHVDMQWTYRADPHQHRLMQDRLHHRVLDVKWELAPLEKEKVAALKGAVVADMRGDLHRCHHLRKRARNFEIAKPPAFYVGDEDYSPPINKANFDFLIGLENELTELEDKLLELLEDDDRDQYQKLATECEKRHLMFSGIMKGVVARIIPRELWNEPLAEFFRRADPRLMGCDGCFDPLNIVPREWGVPAKTINCLHMEMLHLHWLHASFVPRVQPAPPQFMAGTVQAQIVPRLVFDIFSSQWNLLVPASPISPLLTSPSGGLMPPNTLSRKRPREDELILSQT